MIKVRDSQPGVWVPLRVREQFAGGMPNFKLTQNEFILAVKPGGLNSRDQSRSRYSRSSVRFLILISILNISICRDQFLNLSRMSLLSRQDYFFVLVKIFTIETYEFRLCQVEILVETVMSRLSRQIEIVEIY
jgi:hypothetical protein